jgi:2-keto-4-pentenoate hydratase/2-oxohepta-3-ene-1,7-dioic acid hydratase in catechol pathway
LAFGAKLLTDRRLLVKFVTFNGGRIGLVEGEEIVDLSSLLPFPPESWPPVGMVRFIAEFSGLGDKIERARTHGRRLALSAARLEAPICWPNKVIAFPANYHEHIDEMKAGTGLISTFKADGQGFFLKANSSLSGPCDAIVLPKVSGREIHHECELAVVIGKGGRDIRRDDALGHIFGYSCLLDMVIRGKEERVMRKSFDTFCPMGPWIVTSEEIADHEDIEMELSVGAEIRQRANTRDLIVDIPAMIGMASSVMTLYPGDIIATGTPAGVGPVRSGDRIRINIAGVGAMELSVVQGEMGDHDVWRKPPS